MMAICYSEEGGDTLDIFEDEVRSGPMGRNRELHRLFDTLQGRAGAAGPGAAGEARPDGLVPINPSRFQVLYCTALCIFSCNVPNGIKSECGLHYIIQSATLPQYCNTIWTPSKTLDTKRTLGAVMTDPYQQFENCEMFVKNIFWVIFHAFICINCANNLQD